MSRHLVTIEQALAHLREIDEELSAAKAADLEQMMFAASEAVVNYLQSAADDYFDENGDVIEDSDGEPDVPQVVKRATLLLIGYFCKDRDNDAGHEWEPGYLPRPVTALLYPLRDPAIG